MHYGFQKVDTDFYINSKFFSKILMDAIILTISTFQMNGGTNDAVSAKVQMVVACLAAV